MARPIVLARHAVAAAEIAAIRDADTEVAKRSARPVGENVSGVFLSHDRSQFSTVTEA